jgi:alpha-beta hydrolase superfamily lysophospholipase
VLSAPWLGTAVTIPRWKELSAAVLRRLAPALRISTAIDAAQLTADPELQQAYLQDRLVGHGISVSLYDAVLDAQARAAGWAPSADLPALVLLPTADRVVDSSATERWLATAGGARLDVRRLPSARHEPHNDLGRDELYRLIADWLDARTPGARGG